MFAHSTELCLIYAKRVEKQLQRSKSVNKQINKQKFEIIMNGIILQDLFRVIHIWNMLSVYVQNWWHTVTDPQFRPGKLFVWLFFFLIILWY